MRDQWIGWLQEKQRHFFYGVTFVVAALFIAFQLFGKFHKPQTSQYFVANQAFEKWLVQGEAFDKLEHAIHAHPELETKFGAMIADKFIAQNQGEKAQPFAESVFQRVLKQTPEHVAFAEGSLLIAKGNVGEALTHAVSLKDRLNETSLLYGFNLVRIASLYNVLENRDQEIAVLEELEQYMAGNEKAASVLTDCFNEGDSTLIDYIQERKTHNLN
ncbi:MAG: hypothetical protein K1000chlam2_00655 [Chlamydiae bacterium]|nr:hypothetical protein [Chlamydiota bacterium]